MRVDVSLVFGSARYLLVVDFYVMLYFFVSDFKFCFVPHVVVLLNRSPYFVSFFLVFTLPLLLL